MAGHEPPTELRRALIRANAIQRRPREKMMTRPNFCFADIFRLMMRRRGRAMTSFFYLKISGLNEHYR